MEIWIRIWNVRFYQNLNFCSENINRYEIRRKGLVVTTLKIKTQSKRVSLITYFRYTIQNVPLNNKTKLFV